MGGDPDDQGNARPLTQTGRPARRPIMLVVIAPGKSLTLSIDGAIRKPCG